MTTDCKTRCKRKEGGLGVKSSHLKWENHSDLLISSGLYSACRLPWRFTADTPDGMIEGMPGDWWVANKDSVQFLTDDEFHDKFTKYGCFFHYRLKTKDAAELREEEWTYKQIVIKECERKERSDLRK